MKDDTISRRAALDALGERPMVWTDDDYVLGARNQYDMDRLAIETVPSAQPEDRCGECDAWNQYKNYPQPGWIPWDSGELPKESGWYIVTAYDGRTSRTTFTKYQKRLKRWDLTGARAYWRVLAWRPLPEPYTGKDGDGDV